MFMLYNYIEQGILKIPLQLKNFHLFYEIVIKIINRDMLIKKLERGSGILKIPCPDVEPFIDFKLPILFHNLKQLYTLFNLD